jgi:cytochrome c553
MNKKLIIAKIKSVKSTILFASTLVVGLNCNAADIVGNAKNAENKVAMCIGCHAIQNYKASFPFVYSVPLIGGQNEKYITKALSAYKQGERKHPSMRGIASTLSDQDIADLAAYYSQKR